MKKFTINDNEAYSLDLQISDCSSPKDLRCVEFVQTVKNKEKSNMVSTYQFFLTRDELLRVTKSFLEATDD